MPINHRQFVYYFTNFNNSKLVKFKDKFDQLDSIIKYYFRYFIIANLSQLVITMVAIVVVVIIMVIIEIVIIKELSK